MKAKNGVKNRVIFSKPYFMVHPREYLENGEKVARGTRKELYTRYRGKLNERFLSSERAETALSFFPDEDRALLEVVECMDAVL